MAAAGKETLEMKVVKKRPTVNWNRVWRNLHTPGVSEEITSAWYSVIHGIVPANVRMAAMHRVDTGACRQRGKPDTLTHLLTECAAGTPIWNWILYRIAMMIWTDPRNVSTEWILCPQFYFWPPQKQSNTVDSSPLCMVPHTDPAPSIARRLYWLYEAVEVERISTTKKNSRNRQLPGRAIDSTAPKEWVTPTSHDESLSHWRHLPHTSSTETDRQRATRTLDAWKKDTTSNLPPVTATINQPTPNTVWYTYQWQRKKCVAHWARQ